jgi:hypothetical protein
MLINRGFFAVILLIGFGLVSAQVTNLASCIANGYSQCWCNCQVPLVNQYCPTASELTQCSCTNQDYHSAIESCIQSANCAGLAGGLATASSICAEFGYSLVLSTAASTLASTGATSSIGGSTGSTTSITAGTSGQGNSGSVSHSSSSLGPGAIAGIVIGSIAVLVIAILGTILILQRGSRNKAVVVSYED